MQVIRLTGPRKIHVNAQSSVGPSEEIYCGVHRLVTGWLLEQVT